MLRGPETHLTAIRRAAATVTVPVLVLVALLAPSAAAAPARPGVDGQVPTTGPSSTTSTSTTSSTTTTSTTLPGGGPSTTELPSTTSVPGEVPSTTEPVPAEAPLPTLPPELAADPRTRILADPGPDDGGELPIRQGPWNPASNVVLGPRVAATRAAIADGVEHLRELDAELGRRRVELAGLNDRMGALDAEARARVTRVAEARAQLRDHAVHAFITGRVENRIMGARVTDPAQLGVARRYLESVVSADDRALHAYRAARDELTAGQDRLAGEVAAAATAVTDLESQVSQGFGELAQLNQELAAYEAGAQVSVRGVVFPVAGPVEFIDSWGFPRMTGTASAHWHQGTDIFAPIGTPVVAAESGRLSGIGQASLGGNKLWVVGDSGTEYYYAHLSAYAPGAADGRRVNAGDVVGFVGDTGNARGTSPHLHFEVHPGGGEAVNPYPLLKTLYGNAPMVQVVVAPPPDAAPAPDPAAAPPAGGPAPLAGG